ncbi:MAG TPA: hypothetical protein VLI69_04745 [Gammaproteobacteria bacterium]|nr:hypothetical protein [Gammaproteobacteria bacterium]
MLKAETLVQVALNVDFIDCGRSIINEYLDVLYDMISESKRMHESALDDL